jgi:hypothetical protein
MRHNDKKYRTSEREVLHHSTISFFVPYCCASAFCVGHRAFVQEPRMKVRFLFAAFIISILFWGLLSVPSRGVGIPGTNRATGIGSAGGNGGQGGTANATASVSSDSSNTANATGGAGGTGGNGDFGYAGGNPVCERLHDRDSLPTNSGRLNRTGASGWRSDDTR